jgi:hypothetical protein
MRPYEAKRDFTVFICIAVVKTRRRDGNKGIRKGEKRIKNEKTSEEKKRAE